MSENNNVSSPEAPSTDPKTGNAVQLNVRLQPVNRSGQPIFSNFTAVRGASGTVLIDFGFLEPNALNTIIRQAQSNEKGPEGIGGQLACRMALDLNTAAQLAQQLNQLLQATRRTQTSGEQPAEEAAATSTSD